MSAVVSLEGADTIGAGEERQLQSTTAHHTMFVFVTGEPHECVVELQGSHDGYGWITLGVVNDPFGGIKTTQPTAHLVKWVRANLVSLEGGSSPMVTASIASADGV